MTCPLLQLNSEFSSSVLKPHQDQTIQPGTWLQGSLKALDEVKRTVGFQCLFNIWGHHCKCCSDYSAARTLEIFYIILKWITNGTIRLTARLTSGGQYLTASTRTPWLRSGTVQHCTDVSYTSSSGAQSIPGDSWLRALKGWRDWVVLLILSSPFWNISVASGCGSKKASICMRWLFLTHLSSNWCPYCAWETIIVWSRVLGAFLNRLSFCEASV